MEALIYLAAEDAMKSELATDLQIREQIAEVRAALELRGSYLPNIWVFYSNKNKQLLTIFGDVTFNSASTPRG